MLLQALVKYYEILASDEESEIPKSGYGKANVSYALNISKEGELLNLIPLKIPDIKGKKEVAKSMTVPEQNKKTVNITANFLCHNSSYVFGFDNKGKPERSKKCFEAFKLLHHQILNNVDCVEAKAVLAFLDNWDVENAHEHPAIVDYLTDIYAGANFIFVLNDNNEYVHKHPEIRKAWELYKQTSSSENMLQCLVTGEKLPIARLHPSLKGIRGGKSTGNSLVSFNANAYESYGKNSGQGLNSPVSEYACFAYGTALNNLLSDISHKLTLGDATIVFWAETISKYCQDFFSMMIEPTEVDEPKYVRDDYAIKNIKSVFEKIANGQKITTDQIVDENVQFYVLGLSPNAARLSVRFFIKDSFGVFINRIIRHYQDMAIQKQFDNELTSIPIWKMLSETVSPNSTDKSASPLLAGSVLRSILTGSPYPTALFNAVMIRIRAEKDINYYKASIIKAYLTRCANSKKYEEVLAVALNEKSDNKAYVLGRLFAVLEKTQKDASSSKLNTTIKDRYFTSACANPASVFPVLLKLSGHHISKAEFGYANEKRIAEIMDILNVDNSPFPKNLSLEEQGIFILGYYHQKNKIIDDIIVMSENKNNKNQEEEN